MMIDVDRLRRALAEDTGTAAFSGSPFALADMAALEGATHEAVRGRRVFMRNPADTFSPLPIR